MNYRPHWFRIILLATILHVIFFATLTAFFLPEQELPKESLPEIEWIDADISEVSPPPIETADTFSEIFLPPLEVPKIEFPPLPEIPAPISKPEEIKPQPSPPSEKNSAAEPEQKIKARVKVLPRDLINQLTASGALPAGLKLNVEKIILSLTIGTDGKPKDIEIVRGAESMINLISRSAASAWVFEPILDEEGNPAEIKTELEFTAADF